MGRKQVAANEVGRRGAAAARSTARGQAAPEDFREEGRGKAMGGSLANYLLKAGVS